MASMAEQIMGHQFRSRECLRPAAAARHTSSIHVKLKVIARAERAAFSPDTSTMTVDEPLDGRQSDASRFDIITDFPASGKSRISCHEIAPRIPHQGRPSATRETLPHRHHGAS